MQMQYKYNRGTFLGHSQWQKQIIVLYEAVFTKAVLAAPTRCMPMTECHCLLLSLDPSFFFLFLSRSLFLLLPHVCKQAYQIGNIKKKKNLKDQPVSTTTTFAETECST